MNHLNKDVESIEAIEAIEQSLVNAQEKNTRLKISELSDNNERHFLFLASVEFTIQTKAIHIYKSAGFLTILQKNLKLSKVVDTMFLENKSNDNYIR